jgi:hypothetical protein
MMKLLLIFIVLIVLAYLLFDKVIKGGADRYEIETLERFNLIVHRFVSDTPNTNMSLIVSIDKNTGKTESIHFDYEDDQGNGEDVIFKRVDGVITRTPNRYRTHFSDGLDDQSKGSALGFLSSSLSQIENPPADLPEFTNKLQERIMELQRP